MGQRRRDRHYEDAPGDPQWYKDAIIYELHVRSFQDSSGDGIGDFNGLRTRLPYLQDLGVTALWLLPFYPSPLRDDGYDISDYLGVHSDYGTLDDFRGFLDDAHRLGLRVITELVVNHTSDQHAWFQRARVRPPASPERDFYVWSESPERYRDARIIFEDFEHSNWSWDPVAKSYYWHRFYSHQPDLNYDNPAVLDAVIGVLDHWFGMGVDGMRLDAVPYLIEQEGTNSENLRPTHNVIKRLREHVDRAYTNRIFIAEANQWPEDAAAYFGNGDESHMVFHFPLMPRLFMALRQEDRLPIVDILEQTPPPPPGGQWALFLRNHDELTLEMVTEEERLYMYHVYATDAHARINLGIRRRLAPLLGNHRRRIELMTALLFSLQGTPVLYYGDEIGMGDNIYLGDRNGVRTPMQWSGGRNAGFSDAPPQRLFLPLIIDDEYHHQSIHVAQQLANPHSLLWWTKRMIALRRRYQAFGRGKLEMIECPNPSILAFLRRFGDQQVLVVANLSRFVQHAELHLAACAGRSPIDLFGRSRFPEIERDSYALTLGPQGFLWLELVDARAPTRGAALPIVEVEETWEEVFAGRGRGELEAILPGYIERCTAWDLAGRSVLSVRIEAALPLASGSVRRWLTILRVTFTAGEPERYLLPLGCRTGASDAEPAGSTVARLRVHQTPGRRFDLFDAAEDSVMASAVVAQATDDLHASRRAQAVDIVGHPSAAPHPVEADEAHPLQRVRRGSNAVFAVGPGAVLKLFRRIESGPNPEIEMRSHLARVGFTHTPALFAGVRCTLPEGTAERVCLGFLQAHVPNDGEAWHHAVAAAANYLRGSVSQPEGPRAPDTIVPLSPWYGPREPVVAELASAYAPTVERLGRRTAKLHRALASDGGDKTFAVEPPTALSRRSAYQRMRTLAVSVLDKLRRRVEELDPELYPLAAAVLERRDAALSLFHELLDRPYSSPRIRCHGNLHLGQILHAGNDLVILDFDGEPGRPLYERRLKRSPLHDVATMVRSFHYAAHGALQQLDESTGWMPSNTTPAWIVSWQLYVSAVFIDAYTRGVEGTGLLPSDPEEARLLFRTYLVERAFYELGFELNHRRGWIAAPLADLPLLLAPDASPRS